MRERYKTQNGEFTTPSVLKTGGDIRLVLLTSCQSGCNFCHLEGHKSGSETGTLNPALSEWKSKRNIPLVGKLGRPVDKIDIQETISIAKALGLPRIHLTGGEPTLHPETLTIISSLIQAGFKVGMTTHGEIGPKNMDRFLKSGLSGINFSVHAIEPEEYLKMDLVAQQYERRNVGAGLRYAERRLSLKLNNIRRSVDYSRSHDRRLKVKANSVVQNTKTAIEVVRWCNEVGVDIRLQRDLNNKLTSQIMIDQVIDGLGAKPIREDIAIGDSSGSGTLYEYSGGEFKVKHFGEIFVDGMCDGCSLKDSDDCRERFYGVRIEKGEVSTCIDTAKKGVTRFSQDEFLRALDSNEGIPAEIRNQYDAMRKATEK